MRRAGCTTSLTAFMLVLLASAASARDLRREALWDAVRSGDAKAVAAQLDQGADVNARNEIGVTALWIAASKGKVDVAELLLLRGADVNARDGIWYETPLSTAVDGGFSDLVKLFIKAGAKDVDAALITAAGTGQAGVLQTVLDNAKLPQEVLDVALAAAKSDAIRNVLKKAGAKTRKLISPESADPGQGWPGLTKPKMVGRLLLKRPSSV